MSHLEDKLKKMAKPISEDMHEDDYNSQPIGFSSRGGEIKHKLDEVISKYLIEKEI